MEIQTSTKKSLLLAGWLFIVKLIETFGGVFTPEVPEGKEAECECGERPPVASDNRHAVVVYGDDDKGAGDGDRVGRIEDDLEHQRFGEPFEEDKPEGKSKESCID